MNAYCPNGNHHSEGPFCTRCGQPIESESNADPSNKQKKIDTQWYSVMPKGWGLFGSDQKRHIGERKMLYELLEQDEDIKALVGGKHREQNKTILQEKSGVAVATNKRILFLNKGLIDEGVAEIPYGSIKDVTHSMGMFFSGVQITGLADTGWRIDAISPMESAKLFADCVRLQVEVHHLLVAPQETQKADATPSIANELEKLAGLVKEGFLTREEFEAKKKQLLGL